MIPVKEAQNFILSFAKNLGVEEVSIHNTFNRVLAESVFADRDYPPFNRSAMDGYAVLSSDFNKQESVQLNLIEKVFAGQTSTRNVTSGNCIKIMTGAPVPEGADAVIRVEDTLENNGTIQFNIKTVKPKQNIALQAEDAIKNDLLIAKNTLLDATTIAVLAVTGKANLKVHQLPKVAIVSTGNEIVAIDSPILTHQIRDSNSYTLKSFLKQYDINDITAIHVADDKETLQKEIKELLDKDILILSGGVSKGDADYVPEVLQLLGIKEIFHRVKIKPGAPLWFGEMPNGGVVFGLPGNPVSVQVAFKVFIEPFIRKCLGMETLQPLFLPLFNEKKKKTKLDEYFPCKLIVKNNFTGITSSKMNGSGDIAATLGSDGIALHPENMDGIKENTILEFYRW
jgi:molybdopterin molybdotransferase